MISVKVQELAGMMFGGLLTHSFQHHLLPVSLGRPFNGVDVLFGDWLQGPRCTHATAGYID